MNYSNVDWFNLRGNHVWNDDCMNGLRSMPDKCMDLVLADPPYGIGAENHAGNKKNNWRQWDKKQWDNSIPNNEYFIELFRISKNQIIWGANYFSNYLPPSMGWIFWDKGQRNFSLADGELAFSSFKRALRVFEMDRAKHTAQDEKTGGKIHPTQKPVALYQWLLKNYAKSGYRILDTHMGSQSSRIAAYKMGFDYYGWELDSDYFQQGNTRFAAAIAEPLFTQQVPEQSSLAL